MFSLAVTNLSKRFGQRKVLTDISFSLSMGESLAIVGPNGSGKTTLALLLLGQYFPSRGEIRFSDNGQPVIREEIRRRTSLVAPYLNLYDNLSAEENLQFFAAVAGLNLTGKTINQLLARVGLEHRGHDLTGEYSSGMKQRLKYALAISAKPELLVLDEPTANLDDDGKQMVHELINECRSDCILVIATNEKEEQQLARSICRLGQ